MANPLNSIYFPSPSERTEQKGASRPEEGKGAPARLLNQAPVAVVNQAALHRFGPPPTVPIPIHPPAPAIPTFAQIQAQITERNRLAAAAQPAVPTPVPAPAPVQPPVVPPAANQQALRRAPEASRRIAVGHGHQLPSGTQ